MDHDFFSGNHYEHTTAINDFNTIYRSSMTSSQKSEPSQQEKSLRMRNIVNSTIGTNYAIHLTNIGVLYLLDTEKNGIFTAKNFSDLYTTYDKLKETLKPIGEEYTYQFHSFATWVMYCDLARDETGSERFIEWIRQLAINDRTKSSTDHETIYIGITTLKAFYVLLDIQHTHGSSFPNFLTLIQSACEEMGLLTPSETQVPKRIPMDAIEFVFRNFVSGFMKMMEDMGIPTAQDDVLGPFVHNQHAAPS
ncbi:hypothetical protein BLNAU_15031 [Blattamonas nauphoetae]|uniref:Uncharacterized protein n=1 Tax=Blattamonas nauphoetae TaxID=2049346 RepID=A0ABQ9XDH8_9EUKA|nr:hypothetical protein BLNAU_15031 [Blattamonas nauphoetae]